MLDQKPKIYIDPMRLSRAVYSDAGQKGGSQDTEVSNLKGANQNSAEPVDLNQIDERATGHSLIQQAREEALKEAYKESVRDHRKNLKRLNDLLGKSAKVLLQIRNIVPIFTDEIVVDANTVTVINRPFFFSEHIQSVSIKNINDVYIETIPFLATLYIMDVGLPKSHIIKVKWFWKSNAERARRIITGLMTAAKEGVDVQHLGEDDLGNKLEEIGKIQGARTTVSRA